MALRLSLRHGCKRAVASPGLLLWLWLLNFLTALPAALLMTTALRARIGPSLVHEKLRVGFDTNWYDELAVSAKGLLTSFKPQVIGAGAVFDNIEAWWTGGLFTEHPGVVMLGLGHVLVWVLLLGGLIEHLARDGGRLVLRDVLVAGARHFAGLMRLLLMSAPVYAAIFLCARWLFPAIEDATVDVTSETIVLMCHAAGAVAVVLALLATGLLFDYAKLALVLGGSGGALAAAGDSLRFLRRRGLSALALGLLIALATVLVVALYALVAPGAGGASVAGVALAFAVGQGYLVLRLTLRLGGYAAAAALYRTLDETGRERDGIRGAA